MEKETCSFDGCSRPARARGLCGSHWERAKRRGELEARYCQYPDCQNEVFGYWRRCEDHKDVCIVEGCDRKPRRSSMCDMHKNRYYTRGTTDAPPARPIKWSLDKNGYVVRSISIGNGKSRYSYQHRELMEEYIGRELIAGENVHHKNGIRSDNRIENLELWRVHQPYGQRVSDQVAWAKNILERYGDYIDPTGETIDAGRG